MESPRGAITRNAARLLIADWPSCVAASLTGENAAAGYTCVRNTSCGRPDFITSYASDATRDNVNPSQQSRTTRRGLSSRQPIQAGLNGEGCRWQANVANVDVAIGYALSWEDSTLSGKITEDDGGRTRFGIAEIYHPELTNSMFYSSMGSTAALIVAKGIYAKQYAEPLCIEEIANQDIANKLLSLGINIGISRASKMLQAAVGVAEDGVIGAQTLLALSRTSTNEVLADLRASAERFYVQDAAANPENDKYLNGWLARARA